MCAKSNFSNAILDGSTDIHQGENKFLTQNEAAAFLHISVPTLLKHRNDGIIPCVRIGGRVLYKYADLMNIV